MHGQYVRGLQDNGADIEATWSWLHQQDLKKETEGLILAAQDQALTTNSVKQNFQLNKTLIFVVLQDDINVRETRAP